MQIWDKHLIKLSKFVSKKAGQICINRIYVHMNVIGGGLITIVCAFLINAYLLGFFCPGIIININS
jgi:hypothetical protein